MTDLGKSFIMSSMRVADRISSLIRNEEKSKVSARAEVFRVAVAIAPPSVTASGETAPIGLNFKLGLVDKKTSEHVHFVVRSWPIIKQVVLFIRGVAPKLDVPPLPVEAPNAPPAIVAEDRRKYVQTYVNTALQNPIVSNLKEFADLIGLTEYTALHAHDAPALQPSPSQIAAQAARKEGSAASSASTADAQGDASPPRGSKQQQSSSSASVASPKVVQASTDSQLEACFRVMDVGGAGYLTPEDMKQFIDVVADATPRVRPAAAKFLKESNPFAATDFATLIQTMARDCGESGAVERWIEGYHNAVFSEIYSALGSSTPGSGAHAELDSGAEQRSYDPLELRTLTFVLRVSGIRNITESEIEQEQGLSLPVSLDDFCRLMACLCRVVAFDDLIRSLEKSARGDRSKMLHLVCKSATASGKRSAVKALQDCIVELGGGARRLGKCGNCEAAEQRARSLKLQVSELEADNESLRARIAELEDQLAVKEQSFTAEAERATLILSLEGEVAHLRDSAQEWQNRAQALEERVKDLETVEDTAQQWQGAAVPTLPTAVYELHPDHLGSETDTLVDLPGPLTVRVSTAVHSRQPRQLLFDVFYTGRPGCEYISLRDNRGLRAFGCHAEDGRLYPSLPTQKPGHLVSTAAVAPVELPAHRWLRCVVTLDWTTSTCAFAVNHVTVWRNLDFRDPTASHVDVLDIYPRHEVLYCYANVRLTE